VTGRSGASPAVRQSSLLSPAVFRVLVAAERSDVEVREPEFAEPELPEPDETDVRDLRSLSGDVLLLVCPRLSFPWFVTRSFVVR
jgi:hypothetical protein